MGVFVFGFAIVCGLLKEGSFGICSPRSKWLASSDALFWRSDAFECHVIQVNAQADPWKQVCAGVYVVDSAAYDK